MSTYLILLFFNFINLSGQRKVYYQIFGFHFNFYNNAFSGKDYNYYNGKYLSNSDKEVLLRSIPPQGWKLSTEAYLSFLSFYYHFWNLDVSFNLRSKGRIEKEIFELLLFGNKPNQVYQLKESKGEVSLFSQVKNIFNFSIKKDWIIGLGISYLQGYHYLKTENNYLYLLTTKKYLNLYNEINYKKSSGGKGFGIDIGLGKKVKENFGFKIVIENLVNKIFWQKENRIGKITFIIDSLNLNKINVGNYYSYTKEEKETTQFVNNPFPTKFSWSLENKINDFLIINPGISWAIKEYFNFFSKLNYQPFNFLLISNSLNFYLPLNKDISFDGFPYEIGLGLGVTIKKVDILIFQEYYKGLWLNAKGFSFKLSIGYNLS